MEENRPQYLDALSAARELCNQTQEIVVSYYDEDTDPDIMQFCTLSTWERMEENAQVESGWIFGTMEPKSFFEFNGYEVKFNSFLSKWVISHDEIGAGLAMFEKLEDAREYCRKG